MIWWFLILGVSTLVVVCVVIALYVRLRRHLHPVHAATEGTSNPVERERPSSDLER
jgi:membrane protein required for beta-lactamase induction